MSYLSSALQKLAYAHKKAFTLFTSKTAMLIAKSGRGATGRRQAPTGRGALQDAELQDGDKRLQDGRSPTGLLARLDQLDKIDKLGKGGRRQAHNRYAGVRCKV